MGTLIRCSMIQTIHIVVCLRLYIKTENQSWFAFYHICTVRQMIFLSVSSFLIVTSLLHFQSIVVWQLIGLLGLLRISIFFMSCYRSRVALLPLIGSIVHLPTRKTVKNGNKCIGRIFSFIYTCGVDFNSQPSAV